MMIVILNGDKGQGYVLSLSISVKTHGRFFLLEKIPVNGGVLTVRVPKGEIDAGWLMFVETFKQCNYCGSFDIWWPEGGR